IRNRAVLAAIRGHHERFDGNGYPDGLRGRHIPMLARVITVADCFDALISSRAYRKALTIEAALDILRDGAGSQFYPEILLPFVKVREGLAVGKVCSGKFSNNERAAGRQPAGEAPPSRGHTPRRYLYGPDDYGRSEVPVAVLGGRGSCGAGRARLLPSRSE